MFANVFGRRRPFHWHGLLRPGHVCGVVRTEFVGESRCGRCCARNSILGSGNGIVSPSKAAFSAAFRNLRKRLRLIIDTQMGKVSVGFEGTEEVKGIKRVEARSQREKDTARLRS